MKLNATAYYLDFILAPLTMLVLVTFAFTTAAAIWLAAAATGYLAWTLVEYVVHRVLYHRVKFFERFHDAHHVKPDRFIGAPPVIGIVMILVGVAGPLLLAGTTVATGSAFGFLAGYVAYMTCHHAIHFWKAGPHSFFHGLRVHHMRHHHAHAEGNYGVSTVMWDHVFGTVIAGNRARRLGRSAPSATPAASARK